MNDAVMDFVKSWVNKDHIQGKRVIDVGCLNVNGSTKEYVNSLNPSLYKGVDIRQGSEVDEVCDACELISRYNHNSFDFVISTEMLEHAKDWRGSIQNMKQVLQGGGYILLSTRSKGAGYHGYPDDYWRFEVKDFAIIFSDFDILSIESDRSAPGLFIFARKPEKDWKEFSLIYHEVYSILNEK